MWGDVPLTTQKML